MCAVAPVQARTDASHVNFCRYFLNKTCAPSRADSCEPSVTVSYSISDLAREFDLTTRAIRFYEDLGLLQPQRLGPGGRNRVYSARDRTRLKLTLRAKRLGLSLTEAKEIIDMYDSPRDTGAQLKKFLAVLAGHRSQLDEQMGDLQANLDEVKAHEKEARALLARSEKAKA